LDCEAFVDLAAGLEAALANLALPAAADVTISGFFVALLTRFFSDSDFIGFQRRVRAQEDTQCLKF
jgi:hypothetical protein